MNSLQTYLNRIWRYRWLVLVITVVATLGALLYTVAQPTTYTARSTLTTASENRSPDQDAYLAEGYAQYFNKESYQERIRALARVPEDVEVSALTGANSPILYIEATGPDRAVASTVAAQVAGRFPDDVQGTANASRDEEIARIDQRIKDMKALLNRLKGDTSQRAQVQSEIFDLQGQANDLRDNTTNQLIDLQRDAGVSTHQPSPILNGLLGFAGGLALGCAAALALAALRNRITTPADVRGLLGLPTLTVLDGVRPHDDQARAQRLESLAAVVSLSDLPRPATLAITTPRRTSLTSQVAEGIVYYRALQGTRTLLVQADLRGASTEATSHEATVAGLLAGISARPPTPIEIAIGTAEMLVVPAGMPLTNDPFALFAPARFDALLRDLSGLADLIVIEAPPVNEAAESQIICAAADQTVLVVQEGITRGNDGSRACGLLTQVGASMLGVVLGRPVQKKRHAELFSTLPVVDRTPATNQQANADQQASAVQQATDEQPAEQVTVEELAGVEGLAWVEEEPAGVEEELAWVEEEPAGVAEPAWVEEELAWVEEEPAGVEEEPAGVEEEPAGVAEPAGVEEEPAGVEEEPAGVEEEPAGLDRQVVASEHQAVDDQPAEDRLPAKEQTTAEELTPDAKQQPVAGNAATAETLVALKEDAAFDEQATAVHQATDEQPADERAAAVEQQPDGGRGHVGEESAGPEQAVHPAPERTLEGWNLYTDAYSDWSLDDDNQQPSVVIDDVDEAHVANGQLLTTSQANKPRPAPSVAAEADGQTNTDQTAGDRQVSSGQGGATMTRRRDRKTSSKADRRSSRT
jgi:succinoglycan biosynthesis transport protein ExoP